MAKSPGKLKLSGKLVPFRKCPGCDTPMPRKSKQCNVCGTALVTRKDPRTSTTVRDLALMGVMIFLLGGAGILALVAAFQRFAVPEQTASSEAPAGQAAPYAELTRAPPPRATQVKVEVPADPAPLDVADVTVPAEPLPDEPFEAEFQEETVADKAPRKPEGQILFEKAKKLEQQAQLQRRETEPGRMNMRDSIQAYRAAAGQGHGPAWFRLGEIYLQGEWVPKSERNALRYFIEAGTLGIQAGQTSAALLAAESDSPFAGCPSCMDWLKQAAERGHARSLLKLGYLYREGKHVELDPGKALDAFRRAADGGEPEALNEVGNLLMTGQAGTVDVPGAYRYFLRAAGEGHTDGLIRFVSTLKDEVETGLAMTTPILSKGEEVDIRKSNGHVIRGVISEIDTDRVRVQDAGALLEVFFADMDVDSRTKLDPTFRNQLVGIQLHEMLAGFGSPLAGSAANQVYAALDLPRLQRAEELRTKGLMHYEGVGGLVDYPLAFFWFRLAAQQDDTLAQHYLGVMYYRGQGVNVNESQALAWMQRAAAAGHSSSAQFVRAHRERQSKYEELQAEARQAEERERAYQAHILAQFAGEQRYETSFHSGTKGSTGGGSSYRD